MFTFMACLELRRKASIHSPLHCMLTPSRRPTSDCKISPNPMSIVIRDVVSREVRVLLKEAALSGMHFPF